MSILENNPYRKDFPLIDQIVDGKRLAYLDSANTTLKPLPVIEEMDRYYRAETSNIHRAHYWLSENATNKFEETRDKIAKFIHAPDRKQVIFTKGTTESVNLVAQSYVRKFLKAGDEILLSQMEHHSNIVPWQMAAKEKGIIIKKIPINQKGEIIFDEYKKLLSDKVKLVSVVHISNALGTINPVREMIKLAHTYGAKVFVDGAQSISHLPINVQDLDVDFFAFSGHKMFGPTGVGVLYGKEDVLNAMDPYQGGGSMIDRVTFEETTYNVLPLKFEAGTPPIAGVIALGKSVDYLNHVGINRIMEIEHELLAYATEKLLSIPGLKIYGTAEHKASVISFGIEGMHPNDIAFMMNKSGVAIRTGHHCAQPLMDFFQVPATCRASFSIYNNKEDIDQLYNALKKAVDLFKE
ncbi:aminotransferase class V-fold PLP-dependent enzyme [Peredibacter starrii]|uniref:Cysteine desulfurase n=1 Tax=Peredibacter starrii TaxID=28202 RepID=A0AAX4HJF3_9BACT|nr:cysteine desulfurase [Peredibacter starrii]WPU63357.1 cysteine desulfurase [Peredibacter starrii]